MIISNEERIAFFYFYLTDSIQLDQLHKWENELLCEVIKNHPINNPDNVGIKY